MNADGVVDPNDLALVEANLDCSGGCCPGDANYDGVTDGFDWQIVFGDQGCIGHRPVPLVAWPAASALSVGTSAVSFADFDADGWPDAATWKRVLITNNWEWRRALYFNDLGAPTANWTEGCLVPAAGQYIEIGGYGVSAGDYNNDGFPDYVNEPRGDDDPDPNAFLFLVNAGCGATGTPCASGNANFVDAADCLGMTTSFNQEQIETICLGDVDGDGDVDLLLPAYLHDELPGQHGTFFFRNLGMVDPACAGLQADCQTINDPKLWKMEDYTNLARLQTLIDVNRPEGAQIVDYDYDGDLDVFVQDVVRQNRTSVIGAPVFQRLTQAESGIDAFTLGNSPEEGLLLCDLDLDGDFDLFRDRFLGGLVANRNRGDGTFDMSGPGVIATGNGHGISAADWDNDGDLDLTVGGFWHRNRIIEGATPWPSPPLAGLLQKAGCPDMSTCEAQSATPSWADIDRDGDLDCARTKFQDEAPNPVAKFFRNHTYHSTGCDEWRKRYVRIVPVRTVTDPSGPPLPPGRDSSENEFGARAEVLLRNVPDQFRRIGFTSSAAGYLTQNEYPLHFGLPPDPFPANLSDDLHFDVYVDFPFHEPASDAADGTWRVDWTVNPALGDINLVSVYANPLDPSTLGRPILVYRDGRVRYGGVTYNPLEPGAPTARMYTLGGSLLLPKYGSSALPPLTVPSGPVFAGVRFTKNANTPAARVREIIVDAQLDPASADCDYNIVLLDVTDVNNPVTLGGLKSTTVPHNRRTFIPVAPDPKNPDHFVLPQHATTRTYDLRIRPTAYRPVQLIDLTGLQIPLGVSVQSGLVVESAGSQNLCDDVMVEQSGSVTTPVTVRISRKANP